MRILQKVGKPLTKELNSEICHKVELFLVPPLPVPSLGTHPLWLTVRKLKLSVEVRETGTA